MPKRYIGFNDLTGDDCRYYEYSGDYEDDIEDVLLREIRKRGGLMSLMQPDKSRNGLSRAVITVGPEEDEGDE